MSMTGAEQKINRENFLTGIAAGVMEQAERLKEAAGAETEVSSQLRSASARILAVAMNPKTELATFCSTIADELYAQAEVIEAAAADETDESLALRDYFSQLVAVSEEVEDDGTVNWKKLDDRIGVDLVGIDSKWAG